VSLDALRARLDDDGAVRPRPLVVPRPDDALSDRIAAETFGEAARDDPHVERAATGWLDGEPMDPTATPGEPMDAMPGLPIGYPGACVLIVGPTGGGRSTLAQAALYDHAIEGGRCAYLGAEVGYDEYCARAADIAARRGDQLDHDLLGHLAHVRYIDLAGAVAQASADPAAWSDGIVERYDVLCVDPLSAVASTLGADFDSNTEYLRFHDRLIAPLTGRRVLVLVIDNIGHDPDAKARAKGASAKQDRADVILACSRVANPAGLAIRATKVRSVRAPFRRSDEWLFARDTLRIVSRERDQTDQPRTFRPTAFMAKISSALERDPGLSKRAIRVAVGGKSETVDLALELLVSEGYVRVETDGKGGHHHPVRPYSEPTVPTVTQPCPDRDPDTLPIDRDPVTPPLKGGTVTVTGENGDKPTNRDPLTADALRHSEGPETRNP
jgi:archaellum biogenesis ATPase FlaH